MLLSRLSQITLVFFLVTILNEGRAMSGEHDPLSVTKDSLFLPPLTKYIGGEVDLLLAQVNPGNYEKFYIDTPQGFLTGMIIQFKESGASIYIYFERASPFIDAKTVDWEIIKKERISCIEIYRDNEFITLFQG
jgi:hypothetical protein